MMPGLCMESEMRNYILHLVAKVFGVLIHIDGLPYGRGPKGPAPAATRQPDSYCNTPNHF
jgi:hypothetical protein